MLKDIDMGASQMGESPKLVGFFGFPLNGASVEKHPQANTL